MPLNWFWFFKENMEDKYIRLQAELRTIIFSNNSSKQEKREARMQLDTLIEEYRKNKITGNFKFTAESYIESKRGGF